jgi:UDP-N-acetylmuramate--alanine ligase
MSWIDKRFHLMGIGGAGMSALARLLHACGVRVSGDDRADSPTLRALRAEGIPVAIGHDPAHLADVDIVVPSSAIPKDEPELLAARQRGLLIWHRGELIAALAEGKTMIAVAGTHGKSTTTGMLATICVNAGLDPSFIIGATPQPLGTNARWGTGDVFIIEADEYDNTFLRFRPKVAVITNVEYDHPDTFADFDATLDAFAAFVRSVPEDGLVVACADDAGCTEMLRRARSHSDPASGPVVVDYGLERGLWRAANLRANALGGMDFAFRGFGTNGEVEGGCSLRIPGEHNVLNALAALITADACGVPASEAVRSLGGYQGAGRRFELRGEARGVRIFDDYAHHPTEIKATLRGARLRYPLGNIWAIWQPHTYSRTAALLDQFATAFDEADHVIVLPVYAARERKEELGFSANALNPIEIARKIRHRNVRNAASFGDALGMLLSQVKGGDVVITLSAGDGNLVGERLLEMLKRS